MNAQPKQQIVVDRIAHDGVHGYVKTTWDVPGEWVEGGVRRYGLIEHKSVKRLPAWDSVVAAQNFADEIGADFVNETAA